MKNITKKLVLISSIILLGTTHLYAYDTVECSSNEVFGENSCNQCFVDTKSYKAGDNIGFLDDVWSNDTTLQKLMYEDEQTFPKMNPLNGSKFTKSPNDDSFWEYPTEDLKKLYSNTFSGYVLPAGQKVTWIKSALGASYTVDTIGKQNDNIAILVYDIMSHNILENNNIAFNNEPHKECVLYKAGETTTTTTVEEPKPKEEEKPIIPEPKPQEMTKVKTGPEMYFLTIILAFLLSFAIMNKQMILGKIRK